MLPMLSPLPMLPFTPAPALELKPKPSLPPVLTLDCFLEALNPRLLLLMLLPLLLGDAVDGAALPGLLSAAAAPVWRLRHTPGPWWLAVLVAGCTAPEEVPAANNARSFADAWSCSVYETDLQSVSQTSRAQLINVMKH